MSLLSKRLYWTFLVLFTPVIAIPYFLSVPTTPLSSKVNAEVSKPYVSPSLAKTFSSPSSLFIEGDTVIVVKNLPFNVVCPVKGADFYFWQIPPGWVTVKDGHKLTVTKASEGSYAVGVSGLKLDLESKPIKKEVFDLSISFSIGKLSDPTPSPNPDPVPVDPTPKPPSPTPKINGIPVGGMRVLMVYESSKNLPSSQQAVLDGKKVRDYLNSKCAAGDDGLKQYRIWDKDILENVPESQLTKIAKHWKVLMSRPRESVPWIYVQSPKGTFYEGPLPTNPEQAIALLRKYE